MTKVDQSDFEKRVQEKILKFQGEYIADKKLRLENIDEYNIEAHLEELRILGHQLKGNGESYGLPDLGALGMKLEASLKAADLIEAKKNLAQMKSLLAKL